VQREPPRPYYEEPRAKLYVGDCLDVLATLPDRAARTCVSSPPYWGLRDYGVAGQIGNEPTPEEFVAKLVAVFREVRRVLADDGTLWLNLGDSYAGAAGGCQGKNGQRASRAFTAKVQSKAGEGLKPKDLVGIPWMTAFALRADGWFLRSDVIWHKPNPMPESVTDRPTKAHEYVFLLTTSARYFYDSAAIREPDSGLPSGNGFTGRQGGSERVGHLSGGPGTSERWQPGKGRNARTVWSIATQPSGVEHFAPMPPELARRCILAGSAPGDTVLDPFSGAGTTGMVAMQNGRRYVGVELNPEYAGETVTRWNRECAQLGIFAG